MPSAVLAKKGSHAQSNDGRAVCPTAHCRMEMVKRSTIFDMIIKNKTKIMYGEIEGVVILTDIGYLKWKGAHYKQPTLERDIRIVKESM